MTFLSFLSERTNRDEIIAQVRKEFPDKKKFRWKGDPKIGWWADRNSVLFYHGTHYTNLPGILENGLSAPESGPTAGWVSLALEPNTAFGYASMGGESGFRAAGAQAKSIPPHERVVLVMKIPQKVIQQKMERNFRGNIAYTRNRLTDRSEYEKWNSSDQEYYALTEIRFPKRVDPKWIIGYMVKK